MSLLQAMYRQHAPRFLGEVEATAPAEGEATAPAEEEHAEGEEPPLVKPFDGFSRHDYGWWTTQQGISSYFFIMLLLVTAAIIVARILEKWKHEVHEAHEDEHGAHGGHGHGEEHSNAVGRRKKARHDTSTNWWKFKAFVAYYLPEAGLVILLGMFASGFLSFFTITVKPGETPPPMSIPRSLQTFSSTAFFLVLLPPIIFQAGYSLNKKLFFPLLTPISMFAIVGTTVSCIMIASILDMFVAMGATGGFAPSFSELLAFGGLISATDPVSTLAVFTEKRCDPTLFYIVFGESVLNDAVGLVLYETLAKFVGRPPMNAQDFFWAIGDFLVIFIGSTLLGTFCGFASAIVFKIVDFRPAPMLELSLYCLVVYFPFFIAEVTSMSGIVTIMFAGIVTKSYAQRNIDQLTSDKADTVFKMLSHLADTIVFLQLGLSIFGLVIQRDSTYNSESFKPAFVFWSLVACLIARAIHVYPISWVLNYWVRVRVAAFMGVKDFNTSLALGGSGTSAKRSSRFRKADSGGGDDEAAAAAEEGQLSESGRSSSSKFLDMKIKDSIPMNCQHMIFFSGLRGAVAYACATTFPNSYGNAECFLVTTMSIVLITVFALGGTTSLVLDKLGIATGCDENLYLEKVLREAKLPGGTSPDKWGARAFKRRWARLDASWFSPFLIRDWDPKTSDSVEQVRIDEGGNPNAAVGLNIERNGASGGGSARAVVADSHEDSEEHDFEEHATKPKPKTAKEMRAANKAQALEIDDDI